MALDEKVATNGRNQNLAKQILDRSKLSPMEKLSMVINQGSLSSFDLPVPMNKVITRRLSMQAFKSTMDVEKELNLPMPVMRDSAVVSSFSNMHPAKSLQSANFIM